jgi:hypothetical protein
MGVQYMYSSSYGIGHSKKISAMTDHGELSLSGNVVVRSNLLRRSDKLIDTVENLTNLKPAIIDLWPKT